MRGLMRMESSNVVEESSADFDRSEYLRVENKASTNTDSCSSASVTGRG